MWLSPASPTMRKFSRLKNSQNTFNAHCRTFRALGRSPNHIFVRIQSSSKDDEEFPATMGKVILTVSVSGLPRSPKNMRARPQIRDILVAQKLKHWSLVAKFPFVDRNCSTARARRNYWRLFAKHPGRSQTWNDDRVGLHLGTGASHLNRHYCQMRAIGDGIRCKQQPP
jgi:hypothetical protein